VFFSSLNALQSRTRSRGVVNVCSSLDLTKVDWTAFATTLNLLARSYPLLPSFLDLADDEELDGDCSPLPEDYVMRGLVWTQWGLVPIRFDGIEEDDGSRFLEDNDKKRRRAARVLYLGLVLARWSGFLRYDRAAEQFYTITGPGASLDK